MQSPCPACGGPRFREDPIAIGPSRFFLYLTCEHLVEQHAGESMWAVKCGQCRRVDMHRRWYSSEECFAADPPGHAERRQQTGQPLDPPVAAELRIRLTAHAQPGRPAGDDANRGVSDPRARVIRKGMYLLLQYLPLRKGDADPVELISDHDEDLGRTMSSVCQSRWDPHAF
jgi:hypothetical protein